MVVAGQEGFEAFALARTTALYRSALLLCGNSHSAEDLVQETLAKVFVKWRGADRIDNPSAYAHTTLVRTFISSRRRRSSTEQPIASPPDCAAPVEGDSDLRLMLLAALEQLAATDRAVLVLRFYEDMSVEGTAQELGISNAATRTRTRRALEKVRRVLGEDLGPLTICDEPTKGSD